MKWAIFYVSWIFVSFSLIKLPRRGYRFDWGSSEFFEKRESSSLNEMAVCPVHKREV